MFSSQSPRRAMCAMVMMVIMIMMIMMKTEAVPSKAHRKPQVEMIPLQLNHDILVPKRHIRPVENASISPWTYNITTDASLFPPTLSEARCRLRGCLDSEGQEDLSLESQPIMRQVMLLRRVRSGEGLGAGYHYKLESRLIAVGCTCVRPHIRHQQ